jgi:predicted NBD/HSP70 family sugar kinase
MTVTEGGLSLGIDIGGTKVHGVLLAPDGRRIAEHVTPTVPGAEGIVASAFATANRCRDAVAGSSAFVATVGVGVPGEVDPAEGTVRNAVNLGISEVALGPLLAERLGLPVTVDNDVKAAALGADNRLKAGPGGLAYLNVGTGVASAAVVNGRLVRGVGNLAGEIGHLPVDPAGERCACGQRGCIETFAGGGRIAARLAGSGSGLSLGILAARADEGDAEARRELDRIGFGIAAAVQVLVTTYGSGTVALNGGVIHHTPGLVDHVRRLLAERAGESAFAASLRMAERIDVLAPDDPVAAVGAALVGMATKRARHLRPVR